MQQPLAFIPSPSQGSIHLGPLPLRGYALMIIIGVIVAVWLGERRWTARGGASGTVVDIAVWAVPFGLIGGRLYHVITDHQLYFGHGRHPIDAFKVWNGGLGIWGAIALGTFGAYLGCRRRGISLRVFADAAAPGIVLAQAIGRWGNWFNQELYGRPTKLPWAVKIDAAHRPPNTSDIATYQPTFLYEFLWCIGVAILVIWAEKRFRLVYGRAFALYVAAYTVGRAWIEWLRVDPAHHILGLRLNDWTALIVFLCAVAYIYFQRGKTENPPGAFGTAADATAADATADEPAAGESAVEESASEDDAAVAGAAVATRSAEEKQAKDTDEPAEAEEPDEAADSEDAAEAVEAAEVAEKTKTETAEPKTETAEPKGGESTTGTSEDGESTTDVPEGGEAAADAPSSEAAEKPEAGDARAAEPERSETDEAETQPADDDTADAPGGETEDDAEATDSPAAGDAPSGEESRSEGEAADESEVSDDASPDDEKASPAGTADRSSAGRGA